MIRLTPRFTLEYVGVAILVVSAAVFGATMLIAAALYLPAAVIDMARAYIAALIKDPIGVLSVTSFAGMWFGAILLFAAYEP